MKKLLRLLVVLALFGPASLRAQGSDPTRATLDNVFAPLDKSQVPTGFLAEYALPLVPLGVFNGTATDSSRTTPDGFRFIYGTIYSARIYGPNPLPTLPDLNARLAAAEAAAGATIPVMVQRIDYAAVRPDAFSANLLSIQNGQVSDVAGRGASPYQTRTVFAAAPARAYSASGNVAFVFPQNLYVQSGGGQVQSTLVDFGDNAGYVGFSWDTPVSVSYATAGVKHVKVSIGYSDNTNYVSNFDLVVATPGGTTAARGDYFISFAPIAGVRAGGTAYVHLATNHTQLTKPLIVAEGYDKHAIAPLIQEKNYSIEQFLDEISIPNGFNFRDALENIGSYDIVFIDFDNGTDDILANAGLFEAVVDRVNADKQDSEQNVVMGVSMGGLIARYKLAEMTKAGRPTQTRLLVLQDSPQRGANVPLGIQALIRQAVVSLGPFTTADLSKTLAQANLLLDQPATQQLILYQATDGSGGFAANTFVEGPYRSMVSFPSGQVPPYQVIAVSQGSQCGNGLFAPYTELVRADGNIFLSPLPGILSTGYKAQIIVNALPDNGQANRISTLQLYSEVNLFFGAITYRTDFVRKDYTCPAGLLALDGAPGGTEPIADTPGNLMGGANVSALPFFKVSVGYSARDKFSFIPTPSALDIADFNPTSQYGKYVGGVASTSYSRVNDFLAQEQFTRGNGPFFNEAHTIFTARNGEWMFDKMDNRPIAANACSTECSPFPTPPTIAGPELFCFNSTTPNVYTVPNLPPGATVDWTATTTAGTATPAAYTGTDYALTVNSPGAGSVTVQAVIRSSTCTLATIQRQISIGGQVSLAITSDQYDAEDCRAFINVTASGVGVGTDFSWTLDGVAQPNYSLSYIGVRVNKARPNFLIGVQVSSTCGNTLAASITVGHDFSGCREGQPHVVMYPNPAANSVNFTTQDDETAPEVTANRAGPKAGAAAGQPQTSSSSVASRDFQIAIYDGQGRLRWKGSSRAGALRVDSAGWPRGIYGVVVTEDDNTVTRLNLSLQ